MTETSRCGAVRRVARTAVLATMVALLASIAAGCGRARVAADASAAGQREVALRTTTPAATKPVTRVRWAAYHAVLTLDPARAFDRPEMAALYALCDPLLRNGADGSLEPGLAERVDRVDPRTFVIRLRRGVRFWDGSPMKASDVAFSLNRHLDPKVASNFGVWFDRVRSIAATGPAQVTVTLKRPDALFERLLTGPEGLVVSQPFVERSGRGFGTPTKGAMCTGPYQLARWQSGGDLVMKRNDRYWDREHMPKVGEISIVALSDPSRLTEALSTGAIGGTFDTPPLAVSRLRASSKVIVGPSGGVDVLQISTDKGPLANPLVRSALAAAIDYDGIVERLFSGNATPARAVGVPGTWGYARSTFQSGWDALAPRTQDLDRARRLIAEAGPAAKKRIVIATSSQLSPNGELATAIQDAGRRIGLNIVIRDLPPVSFEDLLVDAKSRRGIDAFPALQFGEVEDPLQLYDYFAASDGFQNFSGYDNPEVDRLLDRARSTYDDTRRAELILQVQGIVTRELPWIPLVWEYTVLTMHGPLTGPAPTMFGGLLGPWARDLGEGS